MTSHLDIHLDFNNMISDAIGPEGLQRDEIDSLAPQLRQVSQGLRDLRRLGQLPHMDLPTQEASVLRLVEKAKEVREQFSSVLLLGIGGSALGASFLSQSLASRENPRLILCDHLDPKRWKEMADRLDFKKTALVVVSKSGKTLETLAAFFFFRKCFEERLRGNWKKQAWVITDPHEGSLRKIANDSALESFEIPAGVGGRFSILSAAGLFPAAFIGIDIQAILEGARAMDTRCQTDDPWFNPPLMSAALHYLMDLRKGKKIRVIMPYGESLKGYAPWFSQLWAESLGKRFSLQGEEVFAGTTPVVAVGPQDQHSQLQLYLEGPRDKTVTFITIEGGEEKGDLRIPDDSISFLAGRSVGGLLQAERLATEKALAENGRPNQAILLKEVNPHTIGQLIYMAELETVFAGELYNVNPFDQPAIDKIKRNIQDYLSGKLPEKKNRTYII